MRHLRKVMTLVVAALMALVVATPAWAETTTPSITINTGAEESEVNTDTTQYKWYRIFDASIEEDPTSQGATQSEGKVAYYVDSQAKVTAIESTGLFNVVRVGTNDKWFVELKDARTPAATIAKKFTEMDKTAFASGDFAQNNGQALSGDVAPGYYFITSTAGTNVVIQTLTAVEIDEKNTFPTSDKVVGEDDKNAQIGDDISYTLTVVIPQTANDTIVLTDTMSAGLTFKRIDSVKADSDTVDYTLNPTSPSVTDKTFTITLDAATVKANQGKTITIQYTAVLNKDAVAGTPQKNIVVLNYGNNYESKPKETETYTYSFDFDKVDGTDGTKLTGAEFQLTLDGETPINLIEVEKGKTYRIAMSEDTATPVTTIETIGETITINGLDSDTAYKLVETKAPTSYNKINGPIEVKATTSTGEGDDAATTIAFAHQDVENNKGSVLPSTGGMGTTILYIVGGIMVAGAAIYLLTKKRASNM